MPVLKRFLKIRKFRGQRDDLTLSKWTPNYSKRLSHWGSGIFIILWNTVFPLSSVERSLSSISSLPAQQFYTLHSCFTDNAKSAKWNIKLILVIILFYHKWHSAHYTIVKQHWKLLYSSSKNEAVWSPQTLAMSFQNLQELVPKPAQANEIFCTDLKMWFLIVQYMLHGTNK